MRPPTGLRPVLEMKVPLRERDADPVLPEQLPKPVEDFGPDAAEAGFRIADPDPDLMLDRIVAEGGRPDGGRGTVEDAGRSPGRFDHQRLRQLHIAIIGDPHRDADPHVARGIRPVDDLLGHQQFVGDQIFLAVAGDDRHRADTDLVDRAETLADRDHVARLDRAVHQEKYPGEHVADRLLKSEADRKAQRTAEHGKRGQVDADEIDADEECDGDDRDPGQLLGQQSLGWIEPAGPAERLRGQPVGKPDECIEDCQGNEPLDQRQQREATAADRKPDPFQHIGDRNEPADRVGQHGDKGKGREQIRDPARNVQASREAEDEQRRRDRGGKSKHQRRQARPRIHTKRNRQHHPQGEIPDHRAQFRGYAVGMITRLPSPEAGDEGAQTRGGDPGEQDRRCDDCRCDTRGCQVAGVRGGYAQGCPEASHRLRPAVTRARPAAADGKCDIGANILIFSSPRPRVGGWIVATYAIRLGRSQSSGETRALCRNGGLPARK